MGAAAVALAAVTAVAGAEPVAAASQPLLERGAIAAKVWAAQGPSAWVCAA